MWWEDLPVQNALNEALQKNKIQLNKGSSDKTTGNIMSFPAANLLSFVNESYTWYIINRKKVDSIIATLPNP